MKKIIVKEGSKETDVNDYATVFIWVAGKEFTIKVRDSGILIREVSGCHLIIAPGAQNSIEVS